MGTSHRRVALTIGLLFIIGAVQAVAVEVDLRQVTLPERKGVDLQFSGTAQAPRAELTAEVKYREGQAEINLRFKDMKPAVLFGGDVTSYVLWAVARDGTIENLGELWVRNAADRISYSTGLKSFGLLVTAESYPLVGTPSELVVFFSTEPKGKQIPADPFVFSSFGPAPATEYGSIAGVVWNTNERLDVKQAEKAFELAVREGAESYTPEIFRDARVTLGQARNFSAFSSKEKGAVDYSRRTVALASEAIQIIKRRKEAEALARQIAQRKAEMEALEGRARLAEETSRAAQQQLIQAETALTQAELQRQAADAAIAQAEQELGRLVSDKELLEQQQLQLQGVLASLESDKQLLEQQQLELQAEQSRLVAEKVDLEASVAKMTQRAEQLRQEREELSQRLEGALSLVADTHASARGMIVNLPDILFAVNEAELKNEARVVLAKLAGILIIMPELNLRVEGHTDATGGDEYNQRLSERRAASVRDFLAGQGVNMNRMVAVGYGENRPVADNESAVGRKQNRRVEIVIAEGVVAEAEAR